MHSFQLDQIASLRDDAPTVLLEASLDIASATSPGIGSEIGGHIGITPGIGSGEIIISPNPSLPNFTSTTCHNRCLFSAKELTTDHALNTYDFEARMMTPAFPRFTTVDPLATDYYPISPYAYCGDDPINIIDPTGKEGVLIIDIDKRIILEPVPQYLLKTGSHIAE